MDNTNSFLERFVKSPSWYIVTIVDNGYSMKISAALHGYTPKLDPFLDVEKYKKEELFKNRLIYSFIGTKVHLVQIRHTLESNTIKVQAVFIGKATYKDLSTGTCETIIISSTTNLPYHSIDKLICNYSIFPEDLIKLHSEIPNIYV